MDVVMPIKDGFQATRDIRDSADIAGTPIIAISASAFPTTRVQCADAGCQAFITKPVRLEEVSALLVKILNIEWTYASDAAMSKMPAPRSPEPPSLAVLPKAAPRDVYQLARSGDVHPLQHPPPPESRSDAERRPHHFHDGIGRLGRQGKGLFRRRRGLHRQAVSERGSAGTSAYPRAIAPAADRRGGSQTAPREACRRAHAGT